MEKGYNKNSFAQKYRPSYNVQRHPRYANFKDNYIFKVIAQFHGEKISVGYLISR